MRARLGERGVWGLVVLAVALVVVAANGWWIAEYRHGYPFNLDEAGYSSMSLIDYFALQESGIDGWWNAIQNQPLQAPLVPAITSIVLVFSTGTMQGFVTLAGFLVLLALASYGIGERLAGPRLGALAAVVVLLSPGVIEYSRTFIFALPAAALLASVVYALLRTEGLQRRGWAIACGAAIGAMLLTRSMTVAFLPGIAVAGTLALLLRPRAGWVRGFVNGALVILSAAVVAATWYWRNADTVIEYLTEYGYGEESGNYGAEHSIFSWDWWSAVTGRIVVYDLRLPLALIILGGLVTMAVVAGRRLRASSDQVSTAKELLANPAVSVAIVFAAGYVALSTSSNVGFGFTIPLAALLPPLAVVALKLYPKALVPAAAVLAALMLLNSASLSTVSDGLSRTRTVEVPGFGHLPWLKGAPITIEQLREQLPGPETRFDESDKTWLMADEEVARALVGRRADFSQVPVVVFAPRNRVLNTNTVQLAGLEIYRRPIPLSQFLARDGNGIGSFSRQLDDPTLGDPGMAVTMSSNAGDYTPRVSQPNAEAALRQDGMRMTDTIRLPDGRELRIWEEPSPATPPSAP